MNALSFMPRRNESRQQQCEAQDSQSVSEIVHSLLARQAYLSPPPILRPTAHTAPQQTNGPLPIGTQVSWPSVTVTGESLLARAGKQPIQDGHV